MKSALLRKWSDTRSRYGRRRSSPPEQQQHYGNVLCTFFMHFICSINPFETGWQSIVYVCLSVLARTRIRRSTATEIKRGMAPELFGAHNSLFASFLLCLFVFALIPICRIIEIRPHFAATKSENMQKFCVVLCSFVRSAHRCESFAFFVSAKCLGTFVCRLLLDGDIVDGAAADDDSTTKY